MAEGGAIVNTASVAGARWAEHLTEINAFLAIDSWDEGAAWVADHESLIADGYFSPKNVCRFTPCNWRRLLQRMACE